VQKLPADIFARSISDSLQKLQAGKTAKNEGWCLIVSIVRGVKVSTSIALETKSLQSS